jgi:hypothetical protein
VRMAFLFPGTMSNRCRPTHVLGSAYLHLRGIALHVARFKKPAHAVLSSGEPVLLDTASVPATVQLSRWTLTAEHWEAPKDLYDSGTTVKYNTTHELHRLLCWSVIPGFSNTSRVGYYTTKFS